MSDPSVDFDLVLQQDLANIVAKAAAGSPLTARERQMIEDEKTRRAREAAKEQKAIEAPSVDQPAQLAEGEPRKIGRNGYYHEYKHYAELYGASARTIKRWVERGREMRLVEGEQKPDPCPLDDPAEMRLWWTRNQNNKCPDALLAAAVKAARENAASNETAKAPAESPDSLAPEVCGDAEPSSGSWEFHEVGDHEVGLEATLNRLRSMEVQVHRQMEEAMKQGNEAKATMALNMWNKITPQVRQVEKEVRIEAEAKGHLIPKAYAEKKIGELHIPIQGRIRSMYREMCTLLSLSPDSDTEMKWNALCDKTFSRLQEEVFQS